MRKVVIDASIALKWLTKEKEENVSLARKIYTWLVSGEIEVWAPDFLLVEVVNILVMKKKVERIKTLRLIKRLTQRNIHFTTFEPTDITKISRIMFDHHVSAYDAQYIHLAKRLKCKLITTDKKLLTIKRLTIPII